MPPFVPEQEPSSCLSQFDCLPPAQLMALLRLHAPKDALARAVVAKLMGSTVRDDVEDRAALIAAGLVFQTRYGSMKLTYLGLCKAVPLTGALAKILKVELPRFARSRRGGFRRGHLSQAGNW